MKYHLPIVCLGMLLSGCENAPKPLSQSDEVAEKIIESQLPPLALDEDENVEQAPRKSTKEPRTNPPSTASQSQDAAEPRTNTDILLRRQVNEASAKIQTEGLAGSNEALAAFTKNELYQKVVAALQGAADYTLMKRRSHWRVVQSKEWKGLEQIARPVLNRYRPKRPKTMKDVTSVLMGALEMANRDDAYERSSGYALIDYVFTEIGERTPARFELLYLKSMAARLSLARQTEERRLLVEIVGRHDRNGKLFAFMVSTILNESVWAVRVESLKSLRHCVTRFKKCRLSKIMLNLLYKAYTDDRTRGALALYAGALKFAGVTDWCTGKLGGGPMAQACRKSLALVQTRRAFDTLTKWINKRMHQPETQVMGNYGFRDEFKVLRPYADIQFAKNRYYLLLQSVLGQDMRDGYATGGIVRGMADLEDAKRALNIVTITKAIYETKWGKEPSHRSQQFLFSELGKMEAHLTPRAKQQARKEARSTLRIKKP